jgi:hypothetical protein
VACFASCVGSIEETVDLTRALLQLAHATTNEDRSTASRLGSDSVSTQRSLSVRWSSYKHFKNLVAKVKLENSIRTSREGWLAPASLTQLQLQETSSVRPAGQATLPDLFDFKFHFVICFYL